MKTIYSLFLILLIALFISSCSLLTHYPNQFSPARVLINQGNLEAAYQTVSSRAKESNLDKLCYQLEAGAISHTEGNYGRSISDFFAAQDTVKSAENKASISVSDVGAELGSLLVNEKTIPYQCESYEKIMLYTYQALNYAMEGKVEDARVEILKAYQKQEQEKRKHEKELADLENAALSNGLNRDSLWGAVHQNYADQSQIAALESSVYQNAFSYYLSAMIYKAYGEFNDAYIDMKHCYSLRPEFESAHYQLIELARKSGFADEAESWGQKFNISPNNVPSSKNASEVIVIYQCGWAPVKRQIKFPIPIIMNRREVVPVTIAFPKYQPIPSPIEYLTISDEKLNYGRTQTIFNTDAAAIRYLDDKMLRLVIKQALRATFKGYLEHKAYRESGVPAELAVSALNYFTEQADLRSWLTLPKNIQVAHFYLKPGLYNFSLQFIDNFGGSRNNIPVTVDLKQNQMHFINVRTFSAAPYIKQRTINMQ